MLSAPGPRLKANHPSPAGLMFRLRGWYCFVTTTWLVHPMHDKTDVHVRYGKLIACLDDDDCLSSGQAVLHSCDDQDQGAGVQADLKHDACVRA